MEPIPEDVRHFAYRHIESVDQLEILRVLEENREKEWGITALAEATQVEPKALETHLSSLNGRGILIAEKRPDWLGRYGPHTPELAAQLERLLQLYRERPVSMIRLVYAQAKNPLRAFAEAFQFRKEGH